ncbi:MAG: hypothetical protein JWO94_3796 [Verrucomicrobiaceae bacterium]|nr:hypothetical protein [Verrucomicrobiaceae bacterium]
MARAASAAEISSTAAREAAPAGVPKSLAHQMMVAAVMPSPIPAIAATGAVATTLHIETPVIVGTPGPVVRAAGRVIIAAAAVGAALVVTIWPCTTADHQGHHSGGGQHQLLFRFHNFKKVFDPAPTVIYRWAM